MSTILAILYSRLEYCTLALKDAYKKKQQQKTPKTTTFDFYGLKNRNLSIKDKKCWLLVKFIDICNQLQSYKAKEADAEIDPKSMHNKFNGCLDYPAPGLHIRPSVTDPKKFFN